jgi:tetratricopeptide (TPR) repeat protein
MTAQRIATSSIRSFAQRTPLAASDARGNRVTITNRFALERFEHALWQFRSYYGDPLRTIDQALAAAPDFALAHVLRADFLLMLAERQPINEARRHLHQAKCLGGLNEREQAHIAAAEHFADGDWHAARAAWDAILREHPRDVLALQCAHLADFYCGDARNLRDRVARVLPRWNRTVPGYSYVLGMYAFGLEECHEYAQAEAIGCEALEIEARDPWAVHAVTHVMEMQGRVDEGIAWLRGRQHAWAPDNGFAYHNWWHLALFHIERGEYRRALELYDAHIWVGGVDVSLTLVDATALLWRLKLQNVDAGERWDTLADAWDRKILAEASHYAFNDFHAGIAFIGAQRLTDARFVGVCMAIDGLVRGTNRAMAAEVGIPLVRAFLDFAHGRYAEAASALARLRPIAHRFGGSHAQRDLIAQTLVEAACRAGETTLARRVLDERLTARPHNPLALRWLARVPERTTPP